MDRQAELLAAYSGAETAAEAERILDEIASSPETAPADIAEYYDELAVSAAEEEDHAVAVSAQRKAVELGCEYPEIGRQMLGWYLLKDGRRQEGEAHFAELRREQPDDPQLMSLIGNARFDAGDLEGGLEAFDEALALARRSGEPADVDEALREREGARSELGLVPDEDDRAARRSRWSIPEARVAGEEVSFSFAWFPRDQHRVALTKWPELSDDLSDPDEYCRTMEIRLRDVRGATNRLPQIAPIDVDHLLSIADEWGVDASAPAVRARYAGELDREGKTLSWPPGRNEPCWCGSGRKYKRCCGAL